MACQFYGAFCLCAIVQAVVSTTSDGLQEVSVLVKWFGLSFERARGIFWCLLRLRLQVPDSELLRELWTFWDCSRMALWIRTMTGSDSTMRLGTMNVRSLGGPLWVVCLTLLSSRIYHVLCLQETRVNNHSWNAVTRAVKARGWQLFPGPQGRNSKNVVEGGTLVLTKWPAEALALPVDMVSVERSMAVKLYRPQQRPLILINVYLHASDRTAASRALGALFEFVAACGEDTVIMGDFQFGNSLLANF